jgi:pimeloyl-ACP methyl ester carboxylesterase
MKLIAGQPNKIIAALAVGLLVVVAVFEDALVFPVLFVLLAGYAIRAAIIVRRERAEVATDLPETPLPPAQPIATVRSLIPDSCYVNIDGARIHYVQAGEGPDVLLIHGIGASIFIWRFVFPLLQLRHRVTAIDLPGFGKSVKDPRRDYGLDAQTATVEKVVAELGLQQPVVVGSSMGGTIALWLGKRSPERFRRIIALAPATDRSLVPAHVHHFSLAAPFFRRALNRRTMRALVERVVTRREIVTDEVVDAYLEPFLESAEGVRAFWSATRLLSDSRLPSGLAGLEARVLVAYGTRDLMVPRKTLDRLVELLPQATLVVHEGGGHHIMEDEPEWTATLVEKFISEG